MNDLRERLIYIRNQIDAMDNLNKKERRLLSNMRTVTQERQKQEYDSTQKWRNILVVVGVFLAVVIIITWVDGRSIHSQRLHVRENEIANDKFDWWMEHGDDEPYPGFDGEEITEASSYLMALGEGVFYAVVVSIMVAGVLAFQARQDKARVDSYNKKVENDNDQIRLNNQIARSSKPEIMAEVNRIHNQKAFISQAFLKEAQEWFPRDYGYREAVDYFIWLVENHAVDNMKEAVAHIQEKIRHEELMQEQRDIKEYLGVIIHNQNVMIRQNDELVRQQMLGNMINSANWMTNRSIDSNLSQMNARQQNRRRY